MAPGTENALFEPDGDRWRPTDAARGPWDRNALHGGPVAALVARAAERCDAEHPVHVARLTVELLRPVPLEPLAVSAAVVRPGRKVQLVDVEVAAGGRPVAWARALRIRTLADPDPVLGGPPAGPVPGHDADAPAGPDTAVASPPMTDDYRAFHNVGAELRFEEGRFDHLGPSRVWVRLRVPVVAGEPPSPLQRVAAAADFGNGVSAVVPFDRYVFINPDLTVSVERPAAGEWIGLDASTRLGVPGVGVATSSLWDVHGPIGRATQSLVVDAR